MAARVVARAGRVCVGGLAVYVSYRTSNSLIESWCERSKYSDRSLAERWRQRPALKDLRRDLMVERAAGEEFDVVVVADSLTASQLALDCTVAGLKTLIIDSEDFNSNLAGGHERFPWETGTFPYLASLYADEKLSWRDKVRVILRGDPSLSLLTTAPHLSSVQRTVVMVPSLLQLPLHFLPAKLSDIVMSKPPQYTATLNSGPPPPWYRPQPSSSSSSYSSSSSSSSSAYGH